MTIEALGAAELCNVYGATETYGNCAVTDAHHPLDQRLHSQGLPLPGMTIRVIDPMTREALPANEVGELVVAGYVTPHYYPHPNCWSHTPASANSNTGRIVIDFS
jgi:fatty-acyl-CoA synthase